VAVLINTQMDTKDHHQDSIRQITHILTFRIVSQFCQTPITTILTTIIIRLKTTKIRIIEYQRVDPNRRLTFTTHLIGQLMILEGICSLQEEETAV
jgi:hypothetical protein